MAKHDVVLETNEGIFRGLSKQNMLFHQCVGELVDNSLASAYADKKVKVNVIFDLNRPDDRVDVYISDNGRGMGLEVLKSALQLGRSATDHHRLNEHGFGLKNALATLSGGNGDWTIYSKEFSSHSVCSVSGPFKREMEILDEVAFPKQSFLPSDISTLIHVPVRLSFIQTVQGRGAPSKDLNKLRNWLIEHLGVMYRGYLEQDDDTGESSAIIEVGIGTDSLRVMPIQVPTASSETRYLDVELAGKVYKLVYKFGTLDEEKRDKLVRGGKAQF